jgi:RNA polymerase sigma-70 factor (ECF subfamily)
VTPAEPEARSLPDGLKSNDPDAFRALVEAFQAKVLSTCFRFLHNREDAEDAAQDVFVEIHRSRGAFREEAELSTWIYRIAVTKSLDVLRRAKRKKRFDAVRGALGLAVEPHDVAAPRDQGPDRALELEERSRLLREAVAALPENQRVAVTLARYEGLTNKDIAGVLETSVPAVDSLIHRAHKNLRKSLSQYYASAIDKEDSHEP